MHVCVRAMTEAKRVRKQERQSQTELIDGIVRKRAKMHFSMRVCVCQLLSACTESGRVELDCGRSLY